MIDESKPSVPIGINFGDNDFYFTFINLMEVFQRLDYIPTKEQVVLICNELSFGYYKAFQQHPSEIDNEKHIREYLKIDISDVFMYDEVSTFLETQFLNSEFFYTYLNSRSNNVYLS